MATVSIIPMQRHINGGKTIVKDFASYEQAYEYFITKCDEMGYEWGTEQGFEQEAGGIGHDYRIVLNYANEG